MSPNQFSQLIGSQIKRFSGLDFRWLSFPHSIEERFELDTSERRGKRLWLESLLVICVFDLFLIVDHLTSPGQFWHAVIIRLGIVTPLAFAVNIGLLRKPPMVFRESSIAFVVCLAGMTHLYLNSNRDPVTTAYAQFGIIAVILFANTLMRLRFLYALATSGVVFAGDLIFLKSDTLLRHDQKILFLCLTLGMVGITVIANYSSNREERLNYLLCLQANLISDDLHRSYEKLILVAQSDALTGLANRHAFDLKFKELWESAHADATMLSIIVVDVDHFKQMNDNYGHLYGDKVLKRISHLLTEALRMRGDFAARFGGEEFVILLPKTHQSAAVMVAERLRRLVEVAGFPPLERAHPPLGRVRATVSCGVATAYPISAEGRHLMLNAADRALYEAKAQGRNMVCMAP